MAEVETVGRRSSRSGASAHLRPPGEQDFFPQPPLLDGPEEGTQTRIEDFVAKISETHSGLPTDPDCFDFLHCPCLLPCKNLHPMFPETLLSPTKNKSKKINKTYKTQFSNWERKGLEGKSHRGKI